MKKVFVIFSVFAAGFIFSQKVTRVEVQSDKTQEQQRDLSKKDVQMYSNHFYSYLKALKASDAKVLESLLSEKVKNLVTDDIIKKLKLQIDLNKKMTGYRTGYRTLSDGGTYPMIQYKYTDDPSAEPKEYVTVIFEENGKILGVKPENLKIEN